MSGNGFSVRVASEADYGALGPVFAEAERFHREALPHVFRPPQSHFPPASLFRQWVSEASTAVFVADEAGELVGYVAARTESTPAEEILPTSDLRCRGHAGGALRPAAAWGAR